MHAVVWRIVGTSRSLPFYVSDEFFIHPLFRSSAVDRAWQSPAIH
jgi:hypothetical protein